jgi:RimJ/RimL family protein N-acetyltransferase
MQPVTLRTDRFDLFAPVADDVDAIHAACQDADIQRYTTVPSPYPRSEAEAFIEKVAAQWAEGAHLTWGIHREGQLVGTVGLYRLDGTGAGELGYWTAPGERGRGVVREAAAAVVDWGFASDGLGLVRVEWRAVVGNTASARVAQALGFRYEGMSRRALRNGSGVRNDGWIAGLLVDDDRTPQPWPVLG